MELFVLQKHETNLYLSGTNPFRWTDDAAKALQMPIEEALPVMIKIDNIGAISLKDLN